MQRTQRLAPRIAVGIIATALLVPHLGFSQDAEDEDIFELSPFTVEGSTDKGYRATSTLAGTRIRTNLKDVGSAISVMTEQFMTDTNSNNAEDLLVYATNTEVSGQGGNFVGEGDGAVLDTTKRKEPVTNTRVRGLAEADNTRNYFLSDIPWDGYNVSRVDLQRGPNSILFGIGSPAGIVNSSLSNAAFVDENEVEFQFGSFGSTRVSASFNKVVIEDELAVRFSALRDRTKYRQDPAFRDDDRVYGAITWKPKALSSDSYNTEISANYESGSVDSNNPRNVVPIDALTPWFTNLNKATYDASSGFDYTTDNPWLDAMGTRVYGGIIETVGGASDVSFIGQPQTWPIGNGGTDPVGQARALGIAQYAVYSKDAQLEGSDIGAFKAKSLADPSIFNYYDNLLEGPNKSEFNDFTAFNVALRQNFFNNKLGYEITYDNQDAKWGYSNYLSGDAASISVDVMDTLLDGSPNPNVGRPYIVAGGGSAGAYWQNREREVVRATVYGEYDFKDTNSDTLGDILGRHVFTAMTSRNKISNINLNRSRYFVADSYAPNASSPVGESGRDVHVVHYLGDSLMGASSAAGANLQGIKNLVAPTTTTVRSWNNTWIPSDTYPEYNSDIPYDVRIDPANYVGWESREAEIVNTDTMAFNDRPYTDGALTDSEIGSLALIWQGFLFNGNVVPMIGWRKDSDTARTAGAPIKSGGIFYVDNSPQWRLPEHDGDLWLNGVTDPSDGNRQRNYNVEKGESLTKSVVVHMPRAWQDHTAGIGISLSYSESENFKPDASRIDVVGNSIPSPTGSTKDYGISFSAFEERLVLKINKYETEVKNAKAGSEVGNQYFVGFGEAWGQYFARSAQNASNGYNVIGTSSSGGQLVYSPERELADGETYTQAEIDAAYADQQAALNAWFANPVSDQFAATWALGAYNVENPANGQYAVSQPSGLTVTNDTFSEGYEFELIANPIDGLSISANASRTEASRTNLAKSYTDWMLERWELFQGPAGDVRIWGPSYNVNATIRENYRTQPLAGVNLYRALEGAAVPELAEWRYNLVANYAFQDGPMNGFNFGGSMRYQDATTIGFPIIKDSEGNNTFDVNNPYKGESETNWDFWVGYQRMLSDSIDWKIQANIRNAFNDKQIYPITVQPDGTPGAYRIGAPTTWTITNTFTF